MAELLELIESISAQEASVQRLFNGEGTGAHHMQKTSRYLNKLREAAKLVSDVYMGHRPGYILKEAMSTSDFPLLFGDILDRQLLAAYQEAAQSYRNYVKVATVADFRTVKRFSVYGVDQVLPIVEQEQQYKASTMVENAPYTYAVNKYGRAVPFAWETLVNDDLQAFTETPVRLGRASRRSEEKFATGLFVDANGPHASFYTAGNKNIVTSNPVLSITALQTAMTILGQMVDEQGEPIVIDSVELVVPPALEITAKNILNALQLWLNSNNAAGTPDQTLVTLNWMKDKLHLSVNYYIPIVATTNGNTSWFLFANPDNGRPAIEIGFLRGHEQPEVFMKSPNMTRVGGGSDPMNGDFDTDSIQYKVRHVFGGNRMDPKMTVASKGTGS